MIVPEMYDGMVIETELRQPTHKIYSIASTAATHQRDKSTTGHPQNRHTGREASHGSEPGDRDEANIARSGSGLPRSGWTGKVRRSVAPAGHVVERRRRLFRVRAEIDGDETLNLEVPLDQIDDVLKSLVVYDDRGTAGEVTLPGREPLTQSFVDLPFDRSALASAPALLNALQGSEIRVAGPKPMAGRLMRVVEETAHGADGLAITRDRVTLVTGSGIQQFILQDADSIEFADAELDKKVRTALSRLETYRSDGRRRLAIESCCATISPPPDAIRRSTSTPLTTSAEPKPRSRPSRPRSAMRLPKSRRRGNSCRPSSRPSRCEPAAFTGSALPRPAEMG